MTTQDSCVDEAATDKHTQTDSSGEDIDMPDAPAVEPNLLRRPRKLDNRSGKDPQEMRQHFEEGEDRADRSAATHHTTSTIRTTYERTENPRSFAARQESQKRVLVRCGTGGRSKPSADSDSRGVSDDVQAHGSSGDVDTRSKLRWAEDAAELRNSLRAMQKERDEEIAKREKLEGELSRSETVCAVASQREEHLKLSVEKRKADYDSLHVRWEEWVGKWKIERDQLLGDKHQLLSERQNWVSERERLVSDRQSWEAAQKRSEADLKDVRMRWKQAAKELNGLRAQGQGFYQVDDNYLEDLIKQLRYNIRNFAIQYFSGTLPTEPEFQRNEIWQRYMEVTVDGDEAYASYINSSEKRPSLVQAFLWRIVASEIYDNFRWAGSAALSMLDLYQAFNPHPNEDPRTPAEIEAIRKVYMWKATTVSLLLGSMDENQRRQASTELEQWKYELFKYVDVNLRLLQPEYQEKYRNDFFEILDEAVKLDEELCRQVSRLIWTFDTEDATRAFDPGYMELEGGEAQPEDGSAIALVVAPAVLKQGKSTGAGFDSIVCLLKMQVSCHIPEPQDEVVV